MSRFRTMRDIPTKSNQPLRATPLSRSDAVNQFALLEHEKRRLERELEAWQERKVNTEQRLAQVRDRLQYLVDILMPDRVAADSPAPSTSARSAAPTRANTAGARPDPRTVILEY